MDNLARISMIILFKSIESILAKTICEVELFFCEYGANLFSK